jgi:hypothetical protein
VFIINTRGTVRGTEADNWSSKISTWLINKAQAICKARNEELHRPTSPDNQQIARAALELQARVQELYEQKDNVNYQDRDLFEIPLESRLQHSVSIMRAWVTSTSKTLGICIEDFAAATARSNSNIRDHLPIRVRVSTPPLPTAQATTNPTVSQLLVDISSSSSSDSDGDSDCESRKREMRTKRAGGTGRKGKSPVQSKRQATLKQTSQSSDSDTATESESEEEAKSHQLQRNSHQSQRNRAH